MFWKFPILKQTLFFQGRTAYIPIKTYYEVYKEQGMHLLLWINNSFKALLCREKGCTFGVPAAQPHLKLIWCVPPGLWYPVSKNLILLLTIFKVPWVPYRKQHGTMNILKAELMVNSIIINLIKSFYSASCCWQCYYFQFTECLSLCVNRGKVTRDSRTDACWYS